MNEITTKSIRQSETSIMGDFRALGPLPSFSGDEVTVMRHGETIQEVAPDWLSRSNLSDHNYIPFDINAPIELLRRADMRNSYDLDPPLSEVAKISAKMMARELGDRKAIPSAIYCTPDLASVETANIIHRYLGEKCGKIRIEPELSTMHKSSHVFFGEEYFKSLGYAIDPQWRPLKPVADKAALSDIIVRLKRAFYEISGHTVNALMIVDALSMRIISSMFFPIRLRNEGNVESELLSNTFQFPPLSNFSVFGLGKGGMRMYDLTNVSLRPLTFTGFSNNFECE